MHKRFYFIVALSWTILILYVCLIKSSNIPSINIVGIDKIVHIFLHLFFTLFWGLALSKSKILDSFSKVIWISFTLSLVFGLLIEFLQAYFTTTRRADSIDVLANLFGSFFAIALLYRFKRKIQLQE